MLFARLRFALNSFPQTTTSFPACLSATAWASVRAFPTRRTLPPSPRTAAKTVGGCGGSDWEGSVGVVAAPSAKSFFFADFRAIPTPDDGDNAALRRLIEINCSQMVLQRSPFVGKVILLHKVTSCSARSARSTSAHPPRRRGSRARYPHRSPSPPG
jgi:hypothetical protein